MPRIKKKPDLLGNQKLLKQEQKDEELKDKELSNIYRQVFDSTEAGRKVFRDLMDHCMAFKTTFTGNSATFYNEGMRSVALYILSRRENGFEEELKKMREETYEQIKK